MFVLTRSLVGHVFSDNNHGSLFHCCQFPNALGSVFLWKLFFICSLWQRCSLDSMIQLQSCFVLRIWVMCLYLRQKVVDFLYKLGWHSGPLRLSEVLNKVCPASCQCCAKNWRPSSLSFSPSTSVFTACSQAGGRTFLNVCFSAISSTKWNWIQFKHIVQKLVCLCYLK